MLASAWAHFAPESSEAPAKEVKSALAGDAGIRKRLPDMVK
jgi:hypothetical protein